MFVFDGKMLRIKLNENLHLELDVMFHLPALYVGVYYKHSAHVTHIWFTPIPTLQLRMTILRSTVSEGQGLGSENTR